MIIVEKKKQTKKKKTTPDPVATNLYWQQLTRFSAQ